MVSHLGCCWTSLWIIIFQLRHVSADASSPPQYVLHHTSLTFDQASEDCSPGVLTTIATKQEVHKILELITASPQDKFTFWVGLKKTSNDCVVPSLSLRGFRWMEDGSQETQVSRWAEEPPLTCTGVRCAALQGQFDGSNVTQWGLISISCKNRHRPICKLKDGLMGWSPEQRQTWTVPVTLKPEPVTSEAEPVTSEPGPATPESTPATPQSSNQDIPESGSSPPEPQPIAPEPTHLAPGPEAELKPETKPSPSSGPGPGTGPATGSDLCQHPDVPGTRSFSLDPDNNRWIRVECWSVIQLDLFCSGHPIMWRMLDGSPANLSAVCLQCAVGFQKDTSGHCVDINECNTITATTATCRHTCLNTKGSYRCVCSDDSGKLHDEDSPLCTDAVMVDDNGLVSGILIPILIAVAAMVVLVVVVALTVKCCLKRRSKKRAMKKAKKMAMKSKDSIETANEKTAT